MTEECMKLISSGKEEPMSLKLSCSIKLPAADYEGPVFNIYNIADIHFYLTPDYETITYYVRAKKVKLAKELAIQLHVICKKPKYNSEIILCAEEWSEWQGMGNSDDALFNVKINVIMNKIDLNILNLYNDEEFTDFKLSTTEGSVAVHRSQMAVNSEVFKTMLSGEWKETTEGRIEMEGVTLQTLQDLKDYMYLGALPDDRFCPLLLIARCYLMDTLKDECISQLTRTVSSKDLYDVLEFSFFNKFPELTFAVLGAIPKSMVDDAQKLIFENQKTSKKNEADDDGDDDGGDGDADDGDNNDDE